MDQKASYLETLRPFFVARKIRHVILTVLVVMSLFAFIQVHAILSILGYISGIVAFVVAVIVTNLDIQFAQKACHRIPLTGVVGTFGSGHRSRLLASGQINGTDFSVTHLSVDFLYPDQRGGYTKQYRVFAIRTAQSSPDIYIDSKNNNWGMDSSPMLFIRGSISHNPKLNVEGDLHKYFNIYMEPGAQIPSLVSLAPDRLLAIRDFGTKFDIELVGNYIYIISDAKMKSIEDLKFYQENVLNLLADIKSQLPRKIGDSTTGLDVKPPGLLSMHR